MTDAFIEILKLLPHIDVAEMEQLYTRLTYAARGPSPHSIYNGDEALIADAICGVLSSRGMDYAPLPLLCRWQGYRAFRAKVPSIMKFLRQGAKPSRSELAALAYFTVELLMEDMHSMNLAIGARNLMNHIHRIPAVVNQCFPGYARSGLLHRMILRRI